MDTHAPTRHHTVHTITLYTPSHCTHHHTVHTITLYTPSHTHAITLYTPSHCTHHHTVHTITLYTPSHCTHHHTVHTIILYTPSHTHTITTYQGFSMLSYEVLRGRRPLWKYHISNNCFVLGDTKVIACVICIRSRKGQQLE